MKRHELQKPLIQSALVLLAILLLIGFVAGSNAQTFFGGITSIFKGAFFSVLFVFALAIALLFSIVVLIGVYLAALALYNPETARQTYFKLQDRVMAQIAEWKSCRAAAVSQDQTTAEPPEISAIRPQVQPKQELHHKPTAAVEEIQTLRDTIAQLSEENRAFSAALAGMKSKLDTLSEKEVETASAAAQQLEKQEQDFTADLTELSAQIKEVRATVQNSDKQTQQQSAQLLETQKSLAALAEEMEKIKKTVGTIQEETDTTSSAFATGDYRIFSYFDNDKDKQKFISLIEEALKKEMTYAEIDEFLSKSLSKQLDAIIKDHPSLTREYIRDQRKK